MVKVFVTPDERVDLEAPIQMTEEQRRKFNHFFEERFDRVTIEEVKEESPPGPKGGVGKWTLDHYSLLLGSKDNEEIAEEIGKSEMSVRMKRGSFVPDFMAWAKEKGYAQTRDKDVIKEFFEEKRE
ncbi:hypothetical protein AKJ41_04005 [candidate division MSBL1 archaeon SCGC-AAA259O05]|uniref:Uncharacterized protein n=1 Tax=candidate division MSBL1 archaeon SCGC-AAA259O05 TaxID=1698271 RepID=A0A133V240_9EURY|nr:hypothetical protein AKJ41_04005 [candidate division MSBL1 archaeon SCGC-AAA259O05]